MSRRLLPSAEPTIQPLSKFVDGVPLVIARKQKRIAIEKRRVDVKADVFRRDGGFCRCCGGHAQELHELKARGAGGKRSRYNSIAVCNYTGLNCHRLLQVHAIQWAFTDEAKGADAPICFTVGPREWTR